jgi:hypothetical protein
MAHANSPYSLQLLEEGHNGYPDWKIYAIRSKENCCIAIVGEIDRYQSERIPDTAQLFAAAPELMEALINLVEFMEKNGLSKTPSGGVGPFKYNGTEYEQVTKAKEAIAKATKTA